MNPTSERPPLLAISFVSAAALAFELLLMRLYAVVQWHHYAPMVIGLALLGFGASGSFLTIAGSWLGRRFAPAFAVNSALFGITAVGAFLAVQGLPFNPQALLWDPWQVVWLFLSYLVLALPFFFAANCIGLSLLLFPKTISTIYAWDLVGAGAGALLAIALLQAISPMRALLVLGAIGVVTALLILSGRLHARTRPVTLFAALIGAVSAAFVPAPALSPSPYKGLNQALVAAGARHTERETSALAVLDVVENDRIPLRHAPGLSLLSPSLPPDQVAVFIDAEGPSAITRFTGDPRGTAFLSQLTTALPYALAHRPKTVVLGAGTGLEVLQAITLGAPAVDAVELNPDVIALLRGPYRDFSGGLYDLPEVRVHLADARQFMEATQQHYDLIQIPPLGPYGAVSAGLHTLADSYIYTVEGLQAFYRRLAPGGCLAVNAWSDLPARQGPRAFATVLAALKAEKVMEPEWHVVWIRSWSTHTLLACRDVIAPETRERVRDFTRSRGFDTVYFPGIGPKEHNRYNRVEGDPYYQAASALLGPYAEDYLRDYKFDITPPSDDRPFFFSFFRWRSLPELLALARRGGAALLDMGYLVLAATLAQALILGAALILLPLAWRARRPSAAPHGHRRSTVVGFFVAIGLAFLILEVGVIHQLMLYLGDPVHATAIGLGSFLVFAGLGSRYAQHGIVTTLAGQRRLPAIGLGIAGLTAAYGIAGGALFAATRGDPMALRLLVAAGLIAPLAFLMGMPFPLGLSRIARDGPRSVALAWAVNGCASVVGAALAPLIAIHFGFNRVLFTAAALYLVAGLYGRHLGDAGGGGTRRPAVNGSPRSPRRHIRKDSEVSARPADIANTERARAETLISL